MTDDPSDPNRVSGDGVPLTPAQRVAKYGARRRPNLTAGTPLIEMDEAISPTVRETLLSAYEDCDKRASKPLKDRRLWMWLLVFAAVGAPVVWVLFFVSVFTVNVAITWSIVLGGILLVAPLYMRAEKRKYLSLLDEAAEHAQRLVDGGKATYV